MKTIVLKNDIFEGLPVVRLDFPYDFELKELVKSYPDCQWSMKHKVWWVPYRETQIDELIRFFRGRASLDYSSLGKVKIQEKFSDLPSLDPTIQKEVVRFRNWMRNRRYGNSTIKIYTLNKTSCVGSFITFYCFNTLIISDIVYFYSMYHL